jgi:hypothetical protein
MTFSHIGAEIDSKDDKKKTSLELREKAGDERDTRIGPFARISPLVSTLTSPS